MTSLPDGRQVCVALCKFFFLHRGNQENSQRATELLFNKLHKTDFDTEINMAIPNLLIIAGTGTKSGKTSMACKIIRQFPDLKISAIKISPHFHETTTGLIPISEKKGYSIYEETNMDTSKDTSRMLHSGAHKVFFAKVWDDQLLDVFNEIIEFIPPNVPVICESPALRYYVEPGIFIIMFSNTVNKHKNINYLQAFPHVMFKIEELEKIESLPILFENGKWVVL